MSIQSAAFQARASTRTGPQTHAYPYGCSSARFGKISRIHKYQRFTFANKAAAPHV
ncbi:hypothetical protein AA0119_g2241 [Alternaria tenuissima]|uniref:Uncharacterized protein n=1 Tax=Alternaria tenuissima TaxID=119927 RepID=A0ABY0GK60_9PLEO|nr:hypothetical protein AA0119_g2241 [Alternaria tenuissima]